MFAHFRNFGGFLYGQTSWVNRTGRVELPNLFLKIFPCFFVLYFRVRVFDHFIPILPFRKCLPKQYAVLFFDSYTKYDRLQCLPNQGF